MPYIKAEAGEIPAGSEKSIRIYFDEHGNKMIRSEGSRSWRNNLKLYVDDIEAIRKFFGAAKVSLIGHSWGGLLAMHYALAYPETTDRIILTNSMVAASNDLGLFFGDSHCHRLIPTCQD